MRPSSPRCASSAPSRLRAARPDGSACARSSRGLPPSARTSRSSRCGGGIRQGHDFGVHHRRREAGGNHHVAEVVHVDERHRSGVAAAPAAAARSSFNVSGPKQLNISRPSTRSTRLPLRENAVRLRVPVQHQVRKHQIDAVIASGSSPPSPTIRCAPRRAASARTKRSALLPLRRTQHALGDVDADPLRARVARSADGARARRRPQPTSRIRCGISRMYWSRSHQASRRLRAASTAGARNARARTSNWRRTVATLRRHARRRDHRRRELGSSRTEWHARTIEYMQLCSNGLCGRLSRRPTLYAARLAHRCCPALRGVRAFARGAAERFVCAALREPIFSAAGMTAARRCAICAVAVARHARADLRRVPDGSAAFRRHHDARRLRVARRWHGHGAEVRARGWTWRRFSAGCWRSGCRRSRARLARIVVPVPLAFERVRQRGFNQSQPDRTRVRARYRSIRLVVDQLLRVRHTRAATLAGAQRAPAQCARRVCGRGRAGSADRLRRRRRDDDRQHARRSRPARSRRLARHTCTT